MILPRPRNVTLPIPVRPPMVVFRDTPCSCFFTDIIIHPATSGIGSSAWSFLSWGCLSLTNSVSLSALVCITWFFSGHSHSHRTLAFSPTPSLVFGVPSSVDIHTSLAGGILRSGIHPFSFFIYFLTSMCQYHRLISALHAFATSHHASYFGPRNVGSVQKESTRQHNNIH